MKELNGHGVGYISQFSSILVTGTVLHKVADSQASRVVQQETALAAKSEDLSSSRAHILDREL